MYKQFAILVLVPLVVSIFVISPLPARAIGVQYTELMSDGGFEETSHSDHWLQFKDTLSSACDNDCLVSSSVNSFSGDKMAVLGGATGDNVIDELVYPATLGSQGLALPSDADVITLSFYYKVTSNDDGTDDAIRFSIIEHLEPNFPTLEYQVLYPKNTIKDGDNALIDDWQIWAIDLTAYKGKSIYLFFSLSNDALNATTVEVDEFSVVAGYIDSVGPISNTISINSGATRTASANVNLTLSSVDYLSSVEFMRFSNNGTTWSGWYNYATSKSWNMNNSAFGGNSTQGAKRIRTQFRDYSGNVSAVVSDTIIYDSVGPTGSIKINNGAISTTSKYVTIYIGASDSAGVSKMRFSNNGKVWSGWINYSSKKTKWNMTSSSYGGSTKKGKKYVYAQYKDTLGNISSTKKDSITYK